MELTEIVPWVRKDLALTVMEKDDVEAALDEKHQDSLRRTGRLGVVGRLPATSDEPYPVNTPGIMVGEQLIAVEGPRGGVNVHRVPESRALFGTTAHIRNVWVAQRGCVVKFDEENQPHPTTISAEFYEKVLGKVATYFASHTMYGMDDRILPYLADLEVIIPLLEQTLAQANGVRLLSVTPVWARRTCLEPMPSKYGVRYYEEDAATFRPAPGGGHYITYEGIAWLCAFEYPEEYYGVTWRMPWSLWDQNFNFLQAAFCTMEPEGGHHNNGRTTEMPLLAWLLGPGLAYFAASRGITAGSDGSNMRRPRKIVEGVRPGHDPVAYEFLQKLPVDIWQTLSTLTEGNANVQAYAPSIKALAYKNRIWLGAAELGRGMKVIGIPRYNDALVPGAIRNNPPQITTTIIGNYQGCDFNWTQRVEELLTREQYIALRQLMVDYRLAHPHAAPVDDFYEDPAGPDEADEDGLIALDPQRLV